jgi:hypothetical protein
LLDQNLPILIAFWQPILHRLDANDFFRVNLCSWTSAPIELQVHAVYPGQSFILGLEMTIHRSFTYGLRLSALSKATSWHSMGLAVVVLVAGGPAGARTLSVGPRAAFTQPSEAIADARDGDTIEIATGEYFDCAVVKQNHVTIVGKGPDVVMTDKACEGKALLVIRGSDITVRNLTLSRARVPDGNGAGIRAEGPNLTVEQTRFINNENGILAADVPNSTIRILDSTFERNGRCQATCAHGVYVGHIALLHIERTKFFETREGHHIKSRALRTELIGDDIEDGPQGTASYLVEVPNGGTLIMRDNKLEKGPNCSNHSAAIVIGAEGVTQRTAELTLANNSFANDQDREAMFVRNMTATEAQLTGNRLKGSVVPLSGDGNVQ